MLDLSEACGYSIAQQAALFHSISPLFASKPLLVVANKVGGSSAQRGCNCTYGAAAHFAQQIVSRVGLIMKGGAAAQQGSACM